MSGEAQPRAPPDSSEVDAQRAREELKVVKQLLAETEERHGAAFAQRIVIAFDEDGKPEVRHRDAAPTGRLTVAEARLKMDHAMGWAPGTTQRRAALALAGPLSARETPAPARRPMLSGHAIVFDSLSEDLGGFFEKIERRAVARTLREKTDVFALHGHETSRLLARVSARTLRLAADARGLHVEIDPPNTTTATTCRARRAWRSQRHVVRIPNRPG